MRFAGEPGARRLAGWASAWFRPDGAMSVSRLACTAAAVALFLLPLLSFRLQRDQMHFAYLSRMWIEGFVPYADTSTHQWPGQFVLYALIFELFGASELAIRAVDLVIQLAAAVCLGVIVRAFTRPATGLLAACVCAASYVVLGAWETSNRETYQIAFFLPVALWLLSRRGAHALDRSLGFAAGFFAAWGVFIKPTAALVLVVFVGMLWLDRSRVGRLASFLLGCACFAAVPLFLFRQHLPALVDSLFTYNAEIYSKIGAGQSRAELFFDLLRRHLYLLPAGFLLARRRKPRLADGLLALHLALVAAVVVQGRGFQYQVWAVVPLAICWGAVVLDRVAGLCAERLRGATRSAFASVLLCTPILALFLYTPMNLRVFEKYRQDVLSGPVVTALALAPRWDEAAVFLEENVPAGERIFVYGLDDGLQFLADLKPASRVTGGVLRYKDRALNEHPLIVRMRREFMEDLERRPPDWILAATYDETWIAESAAGSLAATGELTQLVSRHYRPFPAPPDGYLVFRRRAGEAVARTSARTSSSRQVPSSRRPT